MIADWLINADWWIYNLIIHFWLITWFLIDQLISDRPMDFWSTNWFMIDQLIADYRGICECKSAVEATLLNTASNLGL